MLEKPHGWFRSWFHKVWKLRGGGLYAFGFAICFIILEIGDLAEDFRGVGALFAGQGMGAIISFVIDFFLDSLMNTLYSFMWPVFVLQFSPPWGAVFLGLAYFGFSSYLKKPIEDWLFRDAPEEAGETQQ